ncbi:carboxypeptidase family protein [Mumia flava]|uniref:Carboxypeptidase family protein n=1 Tax=Mumia flava TaxID=1348852 RepID=A0A2M9BIU2_9ACTN|nr:carboxypeptidase-like regulatory domain-containing protein [Mumia flava]PJJ57871.1 carboxypeptidase family protein [Mumia flava]
MASARRRAAAVAAGVLLAALTASPGASEQAGYAQWTFEGTPGAYQGTVTLPGLGFPAATFTSDSRGGSGVGVISGVSAYVNAATPVGQVYGSSQGQPYLNLRPRADNAAAPSVTTYVFASPTPAQQWGFGVSDIDADAVVVSATVADGAGAREATAADLGFQGGFNYCSFGSPRPAGCVDSLGDVPTWDPSTLTLTGNPQAADTVGAAGWFQPPARLRSLTLTFVRRAGLPLYATSFFNTTHSLGGSVVDVSSGAGSCPLADVRVRLLDQNGRDLGTVPVGVDGSYDFGEVASQAGYRVLVEPPSGCVAVGGVEKVVDASTDVVAPDLQVRTIVPQSVSGTVTDDDGLPLVGVTVTLTGPEGASVTTTDGLGRYLFDDNALGADYVVSVTPPAGYTGTLTLPPFDIDDAPVTGQDFVLSAVEPTPTPTPSSAPTPTMTPTPAPTSVPPSSATPAPTSVPPPPSEPPEPGQQPVSGGGLPDTGGLVLGLIGTALVLVGVGVATLVAGRRRDRAGRTRPPA